MRPFRLLLFHLLLLRSGCRRLCQSFCLGIFGETEFARRQFGGPTRLFRGWLLFQ